MVSDRFRKIVIRSRISVFGSGIKSLRVHLLCFDFLTELALQLESGASEHIIGSERPFGDPLLSPAIEDPLDFMSCPAIGTRILPTKL